MITPQDGQPIAIAVMGTETLQTFVQVTGAANTLISRITDRMPAILPREARPGWLGETDASLAEVKGLLQTYEDGGNWTMTEQPSKRSQHPTRPPRPSRPKAQQDLF